MFSRMVRRASTLPSKVTFQIDVQRIVFAASKSVPEGTLLSVTFERGEHVVSTGEYPVQAFRDGTHGCVVGEALILACTMYKDSAGKYQEKKGKLVVRHIIKDKSGVETFKALGVVQLDLESFVTHVERQEATFPLQRSSLGGARVVVVISTTQQGESSELDSEEHMTKAAGTVASPARSEISSQDDGFNVVDDSAGSPGDSWVEAARHDERPSPLVAKAHSTGGDDLRSISAERDRLQAELSKAQRSLAASQGSSTHLITQIGTKEGECDALRKQIDQLVETMDSNEKQHEDAVTELIEEITVLKAQLASAGSASAASASDKSNDGEISDMLKEELARVTAERDELSAELERKAEQCEEANTQREVGDALVADLTMQLKTARAELREVKDANADFLAQLQSRSDELEVATKGEGDRLELERELARVNALLQEAQEARTKSHSDASDVDAEKSALQARVDDLLFQLSTSSAHLDAVVEEKKIADSRAADIGTELDQHKTEHEEIIAKLQSKIDDLETSVKQKESERLELSYELVRVKTMLSDANADISSEAEKSSSLQKELDDVKAQLETAEQEAELSMASRAQLLEENRQKTGDIADLVKEKERLSAQIKELEDAAAARAAASSEETPQSEETPPVAVASEPLTRGPHDHGPFGLDLATSLQSFDRGKSHDHVATAELLVSAQETISALQLTIQELESSHNEELSVLQTHNSSLQEQIESMRQHDQAATTRSDNLRDALDQELRATRDDLRDCETRLRAAEAELATARDRATAVSAQLTASQTKLAMLTATSSLEISKLRSSLQEQSAEDAQLSADNDANLEALQRLEASHSGEIESLKEHYEGRLAAAELEQDALCAERDSLKAELQSRNQRIVELEAAIVAVEAASAETNADNANKVVELQQTCASLRNQLSLLEDLKTDSASVSSTEIDQLTKKLREEAELHEQLQLAVHDELASFKAKYEQEVATCESLREEIVVLRKQAEAHTAHMQVVEESKEQLMHDLMVVKDELAAAVRKSEAAEDDKQLLLEEIETLRSCPPPPPPPPPMPSTPGLDMSRLSANDDWGAGESSPMADYSGFGDNDNSDEIQEIARLRSALHDRHTEVGRLQDLYIDVCSKLEEVQTELSSMKAHQEIGAISAEGKGGDNDTWLGELIQAKVLAANASTELDIQKKNCTSLKKTIALYSERITKLETDLLAAKDERRAPDRGKLSKRLFKLPGTGKKEKQDAAAATTKSKK